MVTGERCLEAIDVRAFLAVFVLADPNRSSRQGAAPLVEAALIANALS
jgi:hypothetical protein